MRTNAEIVRTITDALSEGDPLRVMAFMSNDVRWAVSAADREAAPWFKEYRGKAGVSAFFEELSKATFTDFTVKAILADGDLVMCWLHVAFTSPSHRVVDMDEVQIWTLADGKVVSLETVLDTALVGAAFG